MSVTPEALLRAAEEIHRGSGEAARRNAASRAYYAAFHRCRPLAGDIDRRTGGGIHRRVIDALTADPLSPRKIRDIAGLLDLCRRHRVAADYDIDDNFTRQDSEDALEMSRSILQQADALGG